jgi:hypothetical protein
MRVRDLWPVIAVTGCSLGLGACYDDWHGGYCDPNNASCGAPSSGVDPSGIYQGTLTDAASGHSTTVVAIFGENGDVRMSGQDGTYYHLNVGTEGNTLSGGYYGYSSTPNFPNGMDSTTGDVNATVSYQSGISGTLTDASGNEESLSLTFQKVYLTGSSLATLVGTWSASTSTGFSFSATIAADGSFTASDSNNCSYSGVFDLIDTSTDAYSTSFVRTCGGADDTFYGLASYYPASGATAAQIEFLSDDGNGNDLAFALVK